MTRALTLCSLLLLPMIACDDAAFDLAESADRPSAIPDPPEAVELEGCELYCDDYSAGCAGDHFGYDSVVDCEALCGYWEAEKDIDCRLYVLDELAADAGLDLEVACVDAGPHSEMCGSGYVTTCARYCDEFRTVCADEGSFEAVFESPEKCLDWCDAERLHGDDSIECRLGALESVVASPDCEAASPGASCE